MKIGYPCVNETLECSAARTFRLASYTPERVVEAVAANLACLQQILEWNLAHGLLFFRMGSGIVPFGSHEINTFPWQTQFKSEFRAIGDFIKAHNMRVSFHPDQFVVLNSPDPGIVQRSIDELIYQGSLLDLMELDSTAKLQIHAGGAYGDKGSALARWVETFHTMLPEEVKVRLVVENDDRLYSLRECLSLHDETGVPILFDNFHHECLNYGEPMHEALRLAAATWHPTRDGVLMMDYSSQSLGERKGKHTDSLVPELFRGFLTDLGDLDVDMMLEIKDKEASAVKAIGILRELNLVPAAPAGYEPPVFAPRPSLTDAEGNQIVAAKKPRKKPAKPASATEAAPAASPKPRRAAKATPPSDPTL
ncbi:UV DNA damage repair endonuclease UvsE [Hymenobacter sp. BT559]|uniref:UV DNA damage repair endonuclease UvsE n=1 Tax=Hymenobacter sp. BT559 TaxID=2795729 RepID=UPI0018EAB2B6|nr:UV DNA damage repair endonuclease UvsE [Hymenobacter sp. BT559]MBJ6141813.1 UV DNA damage repair endonuclease UvsE [Hymenobacter sp. BT559]